VDPSDWAAVVGALVAVLAFLAGFVWSFVLELANGGLSAWTPFIAPLVLGPAAAWATHRLLTRSAV